MSSIRLNNLTISIAGKTIFDNINITIAAGKYLLKGNNGSGKSTLLNVICGLLVPKHGAVIIEGNSELVSDQIAIPPQLTVLSVFRLYDQHDRCNIVLREQLIDKFAFREHLSKTVGGLSQGSLQKLKIILAVSGLREWLLLDEAFNGLDDAAILILNEIITNSNRPLILVDHSNLCSLNDMVKIFIHSKKICIEK